VRENEKCGANKAESLFIGFGRWVLTEMVIGRMRLIPLDGQDELEMGFRPCLCFVLFLRLRCERSRYIWKSKSIIDH